MLRAMKHAQSFILTKLTQVDFLYDYEHLSNDVWWINLSTVEIVIWEWYAIQQVCSRMQLA